MGRLDLARLEKLIHSFAEVRLLVIGDVVLDEYLWGDVERVSPEAPVPVVHVRRESVVLGGAGNVVRNVVALGGSCDFCAVVGSDRAGERVRRLVEEMDVDASGLVPVEGRPTTRKTRVIAGSQQVVRFDREILDPIPSSASRRLVAAVEANLWRCHGVVFEDYGKGLLAPRVVRTLMRQVTAAGLPVHVDPKDDLGPYRGASLVKPNQREAEVLTGMRVRRLEDLEKVAMRLRRKLGGATVVITRGSEGMALFESDGPGVQVHTPRRDVFDVQGAGDTTIAALTLALRAGASLFEAAVIANAAAGVVVSKMGTATASPDEVCAQLPAAAEAIRRGR